MRDIIFKGMTTTIKGSGEWVYGGLYRDRKGCAYILVETRDGESMVMMSVVPETVCQFTGFLDKNGEKIFEGDIIRDAKGHMAVVEFFRGRYLPLVMYPESWCWNEYRCEVIGNIHNDPSISK